VIAVNERRNRRVIIEKDFQYRFTIKMCLIGGMLLIAYGGLVLYMLRISYEALRDNALLLMPDMVASLHREERLLSFLLIASLVLLIAFLFGLGLLLTHKIAGPLLQLQKRLYDFCEGKRGIRIHFRKNDDFHVIADSFNSAMEIYESRQEHLWRKLQDIAQSSTEERVKKQIESLIENEKKPALHK
jgi:methyl-accepting chemotaxis protein